LLSFRVLDVFFSFHLLTPPSRALRRLLFGVFSPPAQPCLFWVNEQQFFPNTVDFFFRLARGCPGLAKSDFTLPLFCLSSCGPGLIPVNSSPSCNPPLQPPSISMPFSTPPQFFPMDRRYRPFLFLPPPTVSFFCLPSPAFPSAIMSPSHLFYLKAAQSVLFLFVILTPHERGPLLDLTFCGLFQRPFVQTPPRLSFLLVCLRGRFSPSFTFFFP